MLIINGVLDENVIVVLVCLFCVVVFGELGVGNWLCVIVLGFVVFVGLGFVLVWGYGRVLGDCFLYCINLRVLIFKLMVELLKLFYFIF